MDGWFDYVRPYLLVAWHPIETVVRDRQTEHNVVLGSCAGDSTLFVEFMLESIGRVICAGSFVALQSNLTFIVKLL